MASKLVLGIDDEADRDVTRLLAVPIVACRVLVVLSQSLRQYRYDYLDSVINFSWMYKHDRKCDLL